MTTIRDTGISQSVLDAVNPKNAASKSVAGEAQDRFMTLLVTQMKNQDPLNPLDNAQVTSQLAQLSTVTGIDKLNTTMQTLMGSYQMSQTLQAASLIGYGVLAPGSKVGLVEGAAIMGVELKEPADEVQVTIRDAVGREVRSLFLGPQDIGTATVAWDGKKTDGTAAGDGEYSFEITATRGQMQIPATSLQFGMVTTVDTSAQGGVKLNVGGMGAVNFTDVRQIL
jgi:flagellar basal-body rod modification protein FlgD